MKKKFLKISILMVGLIATLACGLFSPKPPTATIQPTSTPIPGWEKYEGSGMELWLPASFEGGDLSKDLDVIVERLKTLGPDFERVAKTIEQNPSAFVIWAFDSEVGSSGCLTNVTITKDKVLSAMTLDTFAAAVAKQLPSSVVIVEQKKVKLDHYEAIRMVIEMELPNIKAKEVMYIIKSDNVMWAITYATGQSEYEEKMPIFEQSVNTFQIQP